MKITVTPDALWERLKLQNPRFQAADATDDQTHTSHALVVVLGFGSLAAVTALAPNVSLETALRVGIGIGWAFYVVREVGVRVQLGPRYKPWDGIGDVLIPLWVTAPVVFESVALLWALSLAVALHSFVFRPVPR